ncbi:hypothetical protein [Pseudobacteriovorax antillogorgiicola]|uniref:Dolichyl-phosphate-mannose-protein mannosyltransferase n=1 Tax=Pseudobacteriovorax antillogorgiicola TaxID=1513793 RepID=A0A1Y6B906_9BACT|nr:hypothetical protein [Pseudobacteriovorax antillogorgiicola]TCS59104.1 hypothetical protein EDD56_1014 [Pseudobacteriovorax antillogorgiicola]SME91777.1 hypothetical protein SAMN06296036_101482 [Pseudobacteriovorax antillogorgiicola]
MNRVTFSSLCLLVVLLIVHLFFRSMLYFSGDFDFLAYHLPFSLMHYDATTFIPMDHLLELYEAFPPLPHIIQGALVVSTEHFPAANLVNFVGFTIMCGTLKITGSQTNIAVFLSLCLSVPLVIYHLTSGYIDFFVGSMVASNFIALLSVYRDSQSRLNGLVFLVTLFMSMLSKYQAWPFMGINVSCYILLIVFGYNKTDFRYSILMLGLAIVVFAIWPTRNFYLFGNPTHPLSPPIVNSLLDIDGTVISKKLPQQPENLYDHSFAYKFLYSTFEISRFSHPGFRYSLDQGFESGPKSPHHRMGGWSLILVCFFIYTLCRTVVRDGQYRFPIAILTSYMILLMFIPQSHELRYWLFIPFICSFIVATRFRSHRYIPGICLILLTINILQTRDRLTSKGLSFEETFPGEAREYSKAKARINPGKIECINRLPYSIYWAGKDLNQVKVKDCTM